MRHASNVGGAVIGAKVDRVLGTSAADNEREKAPADGVESSVSDAAQQLSAWACVTTLSELAPGSVDPCIGQSALPKQQAMRASGDACQPAHSAHPAAARARATKIAAVRLSSPSTFLECTGGTPVSIRWGDIRAHRCGCASDGSPALPIQRGHTSQPTAATKAAQLTNPRTRAMIPPSRFAFRRYHMM